ncbi:hypothetical protein HS088_TW23G00367 [Tripterygium wilfordii]|uniref:Eukaryotic translation initiation factor 5B n=1 Tax=Tripterygium wilfordii TaxID=458696 RepID=A0A7J7BUR7_TRIWF|nr:eukaryotic translation initiation factor 5B [Tripterygium wilfordii]XP_038696047.1 eukaryotic translation initiation factor 5B [Tripterygium wilfordii]KAF5725640.1 hypothetical protein HS088_TW23G00367 [Tripterygium wilfordii]
MGRKKPTVQDGENLPAGGKSKKKAVVIDDDEYSVGTELSEEPLVQEVKVSNPGKKGKKGNSKASQTQAGDKNDLEEVEDDDDASEIMITGKKKLKSKKGGDKSVSFVTNFGLLGEEDIDEGGHDKDLVVTGDNDSDGEDDHLASFKGKKKGSKKKGNKSGGSLFSASAFDAIDDDNMGEVIDKGEDDKDDDQPGIVFTGKKKPSKSSKRGGSVFSAAKELNDGDGIGDGQKEEKNDDDENEDDEPISFSGKKKRSSKSSKKNITPFSADLVDEGNDEEATVSESVKTSDDTVEDEDATVIAFSGKKKSSKKKGSTVSARLSHEAEVGSDSMRVGEGEQLSMADSYVEPIDNTVNMAETSKNKKKKKKSGKTAQEEDELEKILAELGEGPPIANASQLPPEEEKIQVPAEPVLSGDAVREKEGEEETGESAAAKKKKKKKEKEKEKKAAAAAAAAEGKEEKLEEVKVETTVPKKSNANSKAAEKKLPKHVREMQEALARRKEEEERKKREEEERLRKEEEERRRQEELERLAEEARRRKKEREKEKLLKKKQEGKLLTGKQKEEARRLEAMRNQILANAGMPLPSADKEGAPSKRPKYQSKKPKPSNQHANGAVSVSAVENMEDKETQKELQVSVADQDQEETEKLQEVELIVVEEKQEVPNTAEDNGMEEEDDDEEEWDAKSWDDVNLNVKSAFDDEEVDSEPEPVVKKEIKNGIPALRDGVAAKLTAAAKKVPSSQLAESQNTENRKNQPEFGFTTNPKRTDNAEKNKAQTSDVAVKQGEEDLRSPICCIMGHVDTGKTKLLDCIRGTNVQEGEAGGITQQIGATYFPAENIRERTKELKADAKLKVPGLLVIDTPGHESFTNLRSRGSSLCDIAILVVDIMHGLEPQTLESLDLLTSKKTEFIVALNKVDRLYGWKPCRNAPIVKAIKQQSKDVQNEFNMRLSDIIYQFKTKGINTELYYKNKEMGETSSIVPTSAISGEGIPDLLLLLVQWTQKTMIEKLTFSNVMQCTVLEVKVVEGHGTTIDVVLVNGVLHEGDQIVVCGLQGPIATTIRALLTPHPMKELRVKGTYLHHKEIKAAQGIKITGQGLEHAIAGTGLYIVGPGDDLETVKEAAMEDMQSVMSRIDKSGEGVYVQASTLGSLEALLEFLKSDAVKIPVSGIGIGPVHKKDVMKASVMLEKKKEYATILAFDVRVTPEARELADELGVKIFIADIIYHLFDQFKAYIDSIKEEKKKEAADEAVFPCLLKILPNCIFNKKDPIVLGVDVLAGIAKVGTPICIPQQNFIDIGRIASIENNHKPVDYARKGQTVAIKIVGTNPEEQQKMFGRHFEVDDELVSRISRRSIDILKANYKNDLVKEEWMLLVKLKNLFNIP